MSRIVPPSVRETAFSCPHCFAYTTQYWYDLYAKEKSEDSPLPTILTDADKARVSSMLDLQEEEKAGFYQLVDRLKAGLVEVNENSDRKWGHDVNNLHCTKCYNCKKVAVWVYDRLVFPGSKAGVQPNSDLPASILGKKGNRLMTTLRAW